MTENLELRHFVSYTGVALPLNLITPIDGDTLHGRITFFRAYYNAAHRLVTVEKVVYGEIEFTHHYEYYPDGRLLKAEVIDADDESRVMSFS